MKEFFTIAFLLLVTLGSSQSTFQYSHFMLDKYQFNPAYGGLEFSLHANAVVRSQWSGIPDNPRSQYLNAHMPFYIWNGAIGIALTNESAGNLRNISFSGSYNYVQSFDLGLLSFGGSVGFLQKTIVGGSITTPEGVYIDNSFNHNDPILEQTDYNGMTPIFSGGVYFAGDQLDVGVSIIHFPSISLTAGESNFSPGPTATFYTEFRYPFNESLDVVPSLFVKSDFNETQIDIAMLGRFNGKIFGSIGMRGYSSNSFDAIIFMAGNKLTDKFTLAYSYDAGLSTIKRVNEGSHEIRLIYNLNRPIATGLPPKIIYNPRFL